MKEKLCLGGVLLLLLILVPFLAMGAGFHNNTKEKTTTSSAPNPATSSVALPSSPPVSSAAPSTKAATEKPSSSSSLSTAPSFSFVSMLSKTTSVLKSNLIPKVLAKIPSTPVSSKAAESKAPETKPTASDGFFLLLDESTGNVLKVTDREFLFGAMVTEMSPASEEEALKAQAVAAYTYYSNIREQQKKKPTASLKGAYFTINTQKWLIYTTKEQMKAKWGSNFEIYYNKLTKIVDEVQGKTLQYNGALITATYYAISSGETESAKDVWGGDYAYLVPVASPGDAYAGGYQTTVTLTQEEFKTKALAQWKDCDLSGSPEQWLGTISRTTAGSISKIVIGGVNCSGNDARTAFGLRSANFTCTYQDGSFLFTVKGYGHGVGMSQVGAQYMAKQGSTYQEILSWYYPKTELIG